MEMTIISFEAGKKMISDSSLSVHLKFCEGTKAIIIWFLFHWLKNN